MNTLTINFAVLLIMLLVSSPVMSDWKIIKTFDAWNLSEKIDLMTDQKKCRLSSIPIKSEGGGRLIYLINRTVRERISFEKINNFY